MKKQPDELDQLLNEALATYSAAEPRPGIAPRVLRHVRTAARPRPGWRAWVAIAVPVLATLWLLAVNHAVPVQAPAPPAALPPSLPAPLIAHVVPEHPRRVPRKERSPSPQPLTPEERALVALATQNPERAHELIEPAEPRPIEPLEIPKLEIPPLAGDVSQR